MPSSGTMGREKAATPAQDRRIWLQHMAALAVAYAVVGWLGLLLAIPPGYATPIFPASGIALSVLLTNGSRLWPGVWAGSFILHFTIAFTSPAGITAENVVIAAMIGIGATLQALAGVALVRRFVPDHEQLDDGGNILRFLVIGGPLTCIMSTAIGVGSLWAAGAVPYQHLYHNLTIWWFGCSFGVIIAAPPVLAFLRRGNRLWRQRILAITIPSTIALGVVVAIYLLTSRIETERVTSQFEETTSEIHKTVSDRMRAYLQIISSIHSFADSTPNMTRKNFTSFVDHLFERYPGVHALEWVPLVPDAERGRLESQAHRDGLSAFRITERGKDGKLVTAGRRQEYYPVYYVAPLAGNQSALGFDLGSNPARLKALDAARNSGRPVATGRISLVQGAEHEAGFLVFDPVYEDGKGTHTSAARREALLGFAVGVFRVRPIVGEAVGLLKEAGISLEIEDITPGEPRRTLFRTAPDEVASGDHPVISHRLAVADRIWNLQFRALPDDGAIGESLQSWFVLAGGLLFIVLLQAYLLVISGQATSVHRQIEERTYELVREVIDRQKIENDLRASEARVSGIVDTVTEGIITIDEKGSIETVNAAVERYFGWRADEMIGCNVNMLMPEPDHGGHDEYLRHHLATGHKAIIGVGREVVGKRRDGSEFPIELAVNVLKLENRTLFVGVLRDISARKAALEELRGVNGRMKATVATLQRRDRELTLISGMNDLLMACNTREEAHRVIKLNAEKIFAGFSGALAVVSEDGKGLDAVVQWGSTKLLNEHFSVNDCWALRKGGLHVVDDPADALVCNHMSKDLASGYYCRPLMVHGNLLGLLTIETWETEAAARESNRQLIVTMGETIKLALSNLSLREELHEQAIRDPLTGLVNRRAMQEGLEREIARARRNKSSLVLCMLDVDFFKRVNDSFGHDAGDRVLRKLGGLLSKTCRNSDIVCRYGGEEFIIVMADADLEGARNRIENLNQRFKELDIRHDGRSLGPITLSAGIVGLQESHLNGEELVSAADTALYAAKDGGRDRVVIAGEGGPSRRVAEPASAAE